MASNATWVFSQGGDNLILRVDYDASGNAIYQGWAQPGSQETDASWRIKQLNYDGSDRLISSLFANSSPSFTFRWSQRASYTYG